MGFLVLTPGPPLSDLVETIWDCDVAVPPPALERVMPTAKACLIINLLEDESRVYDPDTLQCRRTSSCALDGPRSRFSIIDTQEQAAVMGVTFRPGGAGHLFRERLDPLLNDYVDIEVLCGRPDTARLRERLLEAGSARARLSVLQGWLMARAERAARPSPALSHALALLDRAPEVDRMAALAQACDLSPRHLRTLFNEQLGMSPKRYARLQRFHRVLSAVFGRREVDWAGVAADCGFYDQPHLVHEFQAFSGLTPTAYLARQGGHRNHVPLV